MRKSNTKIVLVSTLFSMAGFNPAVAATYLGFDIPNRPQLDATKFPTCAMKHADYKDYNDKRTAINLCLVDLNGFYKNVVQPYGINLTRYCNRIHVVNANVKNDKTVKYDVKVKFNDFVSDESDKCAPSGEYRLSYSSNEERVQGQVKELNCLLQKVSGRRFCQ